MNPNTAFVAEQKARVSEIADLLIIIQTAIISGNVVPSTAANSIGIAVDALQGVAAALNGLESLARATETTK